MISIPQKRLLPEYPAKHLSKRKSFLLTAKLSILAALPKKTLKKSEKGKHSKRKKPQSELSMSKDFANSKQERLLLLTRTVMKTIQFPRLRPCTILQLQEIQQHLKADLPVILQPLRVTQAIAQRKTFSLLRKTRSSREEPQKWLSARA